MNTLRNQVILVFISVMLLILLFVSFFINNKMDALMKQEAESQSNQTAVEIYGRVDSLYNQLTILADQAANNENVLKIMQDINQHKSVAFTDTQNMSTVLNQIFSYSSGIDSYSIYTSGGDRVYPFSAGNLDDLISAKIIKLADDERGSLVWVGEDPSDHDYSYAIRRINLVNPNFSNGGYLVIRVVNNYFQVENEAQVSGGNDIVLLLDQNLAPIGDTFGINVIDVVKKNLTTIEISGTEYIVIKQTSAVTGWSVVILERAGFLTNKFIEVRNITIFAGGIGFIFLLISASAFATMLTNPIKKLTQTMKNAKMDELKTNLENNSSFEIMELNRAYNKMVENTNHLIKVVYEKELLRSRAEVKALQANINPHLVYNTLNALYWSLIEIDQNEMAEIVITMSDLFRYTIGSQENSEWQTIDQEMKQVERYLMIMKFRLGERLKWSLNVDANISDVKIPKLLIQPLVENAIIHGIENISRLGEVSVEIHAIENTNIVRITVADNGNGLDDEHLAALNSEIGKGQVSSFKGTGIALSNINKRIKLYYGEDELAQLHLNSKLGVGTQAIFEIFDRREIDGNESDFISR